MQPQINSQSPPDSRLQATDPRISAWVMANAGSGKTSLLVSRVLRLLLSGVSPRSILCITYTKPGAAEMLSRIREVLAEWAVMEEGALASALMKLSGYAPPQALMRKARALFAEMADEPEGLKVQTIHAFCQSLLRRFPLEAGVPPHFSLLDDRASGELLQQALQSVYQRSGEGPLEAAMQALSAQMTESGFQEIMKQAIAERRRFRELLEENTPELPPRETPESLFAAHFNYAPGELQAMTQAHAALLPLDTKTDAKMAQALGEWLAAPGRERAKEYVKAYYTQTGLPLARLHTQALPPEHAETLAHERGRVEAYEEARRSLLAAQLSANFMTLARAVFAEYEQRKARRAFLDYDDLILRATALLHRPGVSEWVMYKLDGGINHLLLDEAQDTSGEQWAIVSALTQEFFAGEGARKEERTLFVVGDVKQSIFSFQGAEPAAFARKHREFETLAKDAAAPWVNLPLEVSFRSAQPVLKAVDAVFARAEAALSVGEEAVAVNHVLHRKEAAGLVECWPLLEGAEEDEEEEESAEAEGWQLPLSYQPPRRATHRLAEMVAEMIAQWLRSGERLESAGRAIRPGDILILVQQRGPLVEALTRSLKAAGVPVAGADRMRLTENLAVKDILALLAFCLLPEDELNLACLLKSPLVGVSEEALFALCHERGEETLWRRVQRMEKTAADWLAGQLNRADQAAPYEFIQQALEGAGGRAKIVARMGGAYHEALDELLEQALAFEKENNPSLQGFLNWIQAGESEVKRDMEQGQGEVRILTAHGAKGLEAPIVILPDTATKRARENSLFFHRDEKGRARALLSPGKAQENALLTRLRAERRALDEAEKRRLLYVALTRPRERLYICGHAKTGRKAAAPKKNAAPPSHWHGLAWAAMEAIGERIETPAGPGYRLASAQMKAVEAPAVIAAVSETPDMPAALLAPWREEKTPRLLAPSHLAEEEETVVHPSPLREQGTYLRGVAMHRLLQYLPDIAPEKQEEAAWEWLRRFAPEAVSEDKREQAARQAMEVIRHPGLAPLFAAGSAAEVPLAGRIRWGGDWLSVAGQVDRLAVSGDAVWVADYKTHARPPRGADRIPIAYVRQMAAYRALLRQIYPGKTIVCALIWTAAPDWTPLTDAHLDAALPEA